MLYDSFCDFYIINTLDILNKTTGYLAMDDDYSVYWHELEPTYNYVFNSWFSFGIRELIYESNQSQFIDELSVSDSLCSVAEINA